jgi:hypothetical protein
VTDSRFCAFCHVDCSNEHPCACCNRHRFLEHHYLPRDVRAAYEQRFPAAARAAKTDPLAHYARELSIHWLNIIDAVLQDEGVEGQIRHRVLNTILYGGPNPADVVERERRDEEQVELLRQQATPTAFVMPPDWKPRADQ